MDIKERVKGVADKFEDKLRKEGSELLEDRTPDLKAKDVTEPVEKVLEKETVEPITEPITEPIAEKTQDLKVQGKEAIDKVEKIVPDLTKTKTIEK